MSYFTLQDAEQFVFYRIPKVLFTDQKYKGMSTDSKVLYGLLLDRVGLSVKNNWVDEDGRVYIIFSREEVQELLGYGNQKVVKLFKELKKFNLLEERQRGLKMPNIIYVRKFIENTVQTQSNQLKCENHISRNVKITSLEVRKSHANDTNINNTNFSNISQSVKEDDKKEKQPTESTDRQTENMENIFEKIKDRLDIGSIKIAHPHEINLIDEIVLNIFDMYFSNYTTINGDRKPKELIRSVIMKLTYFHMEELINKFNRISTSTKIQNNKAYMQTMIYNIVFESNLNITNDVKYNWG